MCGAVRVRALRAVGACRRRAEDLNSGDSETLPPTEVGARAVHCAARAGHGMRPARRGQRHSPRIKTPSWRGVTPKTSRK